MLNTGDQVPTFRGPLLVQSFCRPLNSYFSVITFNPVAFVMLMHENCSGWLSVDCIVFEIADSDEIDVK